MDLRQKTDLGQVFDEALTRYPDRQALIELAREKVNAQYSYREVYQWSLHLAKKLQAQGIEKGQRVAIIMSNQSKWIFSAIGSFFCGATLVPIDYKLTPEEQISLLQHAQVTYLITEYPLWKRLQKTQNSFFEGIKVIVTEAGENLDVNALAWEQPVDASFQRVQIKRSDVACIVYSSGTGGDPKGCMMTHGNYLSQAQVLGQMFPVTSSDLYFSFIPTNHAIDFMCGFVLPLLHGTRIIHQRTLRPEYFLYTIKEYGVSHMALVPMLLKTLKERVEEKLQKAPLWKRKWIASLTQLNRWATQKKPRYYISRRILAPIHKAFGGKLKMVFAGGAFVDAQSVQYFYDVGIPVLIGYGLTEAGTVVSVNRLEDFRADTVGTPIDGTKVKIANPDSSGIGEVWVSGPTVMKGYWNNEEQSSQVFYDDWLATGDLGILDDAHLILKGRKKNMIVTEGGKNVYPEDVESWFEQLSECEEFCVFSSGYLWNSQNPIDGQRMVIVTRPKKEYTSDQLKKQIQTQNLKMSQYKRIHQWMIWDNEFPRTASMKIKRAKLAQQIQERDRADICIDNL